MISALLSAVAFLLREETAKSLGRHEELWARYGTYLDESAPHSAGSHVGAFAALEGRHGTAGARRPRRTAKGAKGGRPGGKRRGAVA